ncbi:MAG: hypothetical protein V2I32_06015 [Desulforhopalus sp.]|jgi:hypothetical protein|nr:hypothetical protein [Desulforhopalus sp.]
MSQNPCKVLLVVIGDFMAQRFDLATELLVIEIQGGRLLAPPREIILDSASPEELCKIIFDNNIQVVVCGGIEERHHQFLSWKKIQVFDNVIGSSQLAIDRLCRGQLKAGDILLYSQAG